MSYLDFMIDFSRNWLFISPELQELLKTKKILFAGTGLGSQIAISMARVGFTQITLVDGDVFSESNLNRQHCFVDDLGINKAEATKKHLLNINPSGNINSHPIFLNSENMQNFIESQDYIINCIDFDSPEYLECHRLCKVHNKKEIFVINLGFGSVAAISDENSPLYQNFFNELDHSRMKTLLIQYFVLNSKLSDEYIKLFEEYMKSQR